MEIWSRDKEAEEGEIGIDRMEDAKREEKEVGVKKRRKGRRNEGVMKKGRCKQARKYGRERKGKAGDEGGGG